MTRPVRVLLHVQRMAHRNHLVHLNHPHSSFETYGEKKSQEYHIVLAFNCLLQTSLPKSLKF